MTHASLPIRRRILFKISNAREELAGQTRGGEEVVSKTNLLA